MCGISGIFRLSGAPVSRDEIERMNRLLYHRGPDGSGIYIDNNLGLGHTRLSILDLSEAGRQPMAYGGERYWITYNGEIYNFLELRDELAGLGHEFRSDTDTEIILAAYAQWGDDFKSRLNGMWAFALWDRAERRLLISRDRFGVKPCYFYMEDGLLAFASEIKAFLGIPGFRPEYDDRALATSMANPRLFDGMEETAFRNVRRILPGYDLIIGEGDRQPRTIRWWRTMDHLPDISAQPGRQQERFMELLEDACRLRMRSDVPLATCLSGGIDSSAIFATINKIGNGPEQGERQAEDWQLAFVSMFPDQDNSEQKLALDYVQSLGAQAQVVQVDPQELIPELGTIIFDTEDVSTLFPAQWQLYRELRRAGRMVSLDGHGADECLGGYPYNVHVAGLDGINRLMMTADAFDGIAANPNAWTNAGLPDLRGAQPTPKFSPDWYSPEPQPMIRATPAPFRSPIWDQDTIEIDELDMPFQLLYFQAHCGWLQTILRTYDMTAMAHGIEVRTPFMDWRLFCFCLALPIGAKLSNGRTKSILRRAVAGLVPDPILANARKIGFPSPITQWLKGPLRQLVADTVHSDSYAQSPLWDGKAAQGMLTADGTSRNDKAYETLWPTVQACLLMQKFHEKQAA